MSAGMCRFRPRPVKPACGKPGCGKPACGKPACGNEEMAGRHRDGGLPPADRVY